jgi:hypothetical protein
MDKPALDSIGSAELIIRDSDLARAQFRPGGIISASFRDYADDHADKASWHQSAENLANALTSSTVAFRLW